MRQQKLVHHLNILILIHQMIDLKMLITTLEWHLDSQNVTRMTKELRGALQELRK